MAVSRMWKSCASFAGKKLSGFKVPKRIFIVDSLPQSSSGKVQKFLLRQRYV